MPDDFPVSETIAYLRAHPLLAAFLAVVAVLLVRGLLRNLFKLAVLCGIALLIGLYYAQREAGSEWREQLERDAAAFGERVRETGAGLLRDGRDELQERIGDGPEDALEDSNDRVR